MWKRKFNAQILCKIPGIFYKKLTNPRTFQDTFQILGPSRTCENSECIVKEDYQKAFRKLTAFFLSNSIPFNGLIRLFFNYYLAAPRPTLGHY